MPDLKTRDRVNLPQGRGVVVAVSALFAIVAFDDGKVDEIDRMIGPGLIESGIVDGYYPRRPFETIGAIEQRLEGTRTRLAMTRARRDILRSGREIEGVAETDEERAAALKEFEKEIPVLERQKTALERDLETLAAEEEMIAGVRRRLKADGLIL